MNEPKPATDTPLLSDLSRTVSIFALSRNSPVTVQFHMTMVYAHLAPEPGPAAIEGRVALTTSGRAETSGRRVTQSVIS